MESLDDGSYGSCNPTPSPTPASTHQERKTLYGNSVSPHHGIGQSSMPQEFSCAWRVCTTVRLLEAHCNMPQQWMASAERARNSDQF
jgi:hypothetical protein